MSFSMSWCSMRALVYRPMPANNATAEQHDDDDDGPAHELGAALDRAVRAATQAPTAWPAPSSKPSVHCTWSLKTNTTSAAAVNTSTIEILHRVRADEVVARAEHEAREQEQADADLDEAAVNADREEQRHLDEQPRLARRRRGPRSSARASAASRRAARASARRSSAAAAPRRDRPRAARPRSRRRRTAR